MNERRIVQTGIDVSRYQGKIDWARVKAGGTGFAIIKCTQGVNTCLLYTSPSPRDS